MRTIAKHRTPRRPPLELFVPPFLPWAVKFVDRRYLSDHLERDLGLLDGHRHRRGVRWS
jgi:hypothetical protein